MLKQNNSHEQLSATTFMFTREMQLKKKEPPQGQVHQMLLPDQSQDQYDTSCYDFSHPCCPTEIALLKP